MAPQAKSNMSRMVVVIILVVAAIMVILIYLAGRQLADFRQLAKKADQTQISLRPYQDVEIGEELNPVFDRCMHDPKFKDIKSNKRLFCRCFAINAQAYLFPILPNGGASLVETYDKVNTDTPEALTMAMALSHQCSEDVEN